VGAKRNGQRTGAPPPAHMHRFGCVVCDMEARVVPVFLCGIYADLFVSYALVYVWSVCISCLSVGCAAVSGLYWTSGMPIPCLSYSNNRSVQKQKL
jgi:hypothetical protein